MRKCFFPTLKNACFEEVRFFWPYSRQIIAGVLLIFSCSFSAYSASVIDSLTNMLQTIEEDTGKVKILYKLCREFRNKDPDKALEYCEQALSLAEKIDYKDGIANSFNDIAVIHRRKGNYRAAVEYHMKALKVVEAMNNKKGIASCLNGIGTVYLYQSDYDTAIVYYLRSLKIFEHLGNQHGTLACLNNIGVISIRQGNYDKAIDYFNRSLKINNQLLERYEGEQNTDGVRRCKAGIAACLNNIGDINTKLGNYEKALDYLGQSLVIKEELEDKQGVAGTLDNIGMIQGELGHNEKAMEYSLQSLKMFEELGDKQSVSKNLYNLGILYLKQDNQKKANELFTNSLSISKEIGAKHEIMLAYGGFARSYSQLNNGKKTFEYFELYNQIKDSLLNEESNRQINELEAKYESEKKEKEIELLQKQKELQNLELKQKSIMVYLFSSGFCVILIVVIVIYRGYRNKGKIIKMKSDFLNNMAHEFRTPVANINLALDTIHNQDIVDEKESFNSILTIIREENYRLKDNIDLVLNTSLIEDKRLEFNLEKVNMNELIERIVKTFELKIKDNSGNIACFLNAKKSELRIDETHITNMIINLIDNAIKYSKSNPIVEITTVNTNEHFHLMVTDKGIGMSESSRKKIFDKFYRVPTGNKNHNVQGFGIGLTYVKYVIETHNGQIKVESKLNEGSKFEIILPYL